MTRKYYYRRPSAPVAHVELSKTWWESYGWVIKYVGEKAFWLLLTHYGLGAVEKYAKGILEQYSASTYTKIDEGSFSYLPKLPVTVESTWTNPDTYPPRGHGYGQEVNKWYELARDTYHRNLPAKRW